MRRVSQPVRAVKPRACADRVLALSALLRGSIYLSNLILSTSPQGFVRTEAILHTGQAVVLQRLPATAVAACGGPRVSRAVGCNSSPGSHHTSIQHILAGNVVACY